MLCLVSTESIPLRQRNHKGNKKRRKKLRNSKRRIGERLRNRSW